MRQSLSFKAIVPVALTVTGFVTVCSILLYSYNRQNLVADEIKQQNSLANTVVKATRYSMLKSDRESLAHTIQYVGEDKDLVHLRIFNKKGIITFSSDPSEINQMVKKEAEGCVQCHSDPVPLATLGTNERTRRYTNEHGQDVMAITVPIYNEPGCFAGDCHVHSSEEKVLGTLDIGISEEPLNATLATLGQGLVGFCLMILLLSVGGVAALLHRNVLQPIKNLVDFSEKTLRGELHHPLPDENAEVEFLGRSIHRLAARLHDKGHSVAVQSPSPEKSPVNPEA
ncbi:HAMP domain-containing protein [Desulfuromonas sp. KJ2020]|uniref:HAMP domain-containing protein n=1 Tax=Desulfuromonas sp. KJ2020 TaxID=2919173 RepID=UPI0020A7554F|nr:HAMP domain-containing protein [Desulfuromonas sp. KJ2020]MCP3175779.1 HAMP domain-containing protein [Desulfuromonas sp. KJ2020]